MSFLLQSHLKFFEEISMLHCVFHRDGILNQLNKMKNIQNFYRIILGLLIKRQLGMFLLTHKWLVLVKHPRVIVELG